MPLKPFLLPVLLCLGCSSQSSNAAELQGGNTAAQAAQITLLVLRGTTPGTGWPRAYVVLPSRARIGLAQAASALAAQRRPLHCEAQREDLVLVVQCMPVKGGQDLDAHRASAENAIAAFGRAVRRRCPGPIADASVIIHNQADSVRVSFRAFVTWSRQYILRGYSLGAKAAQSVPPGTCMVLVIGPAGRMDVKERTPVPSRT